MAVKGDVLPKDIQEITEEILQLKKGIDESIFLIGERLKRVRDEDLARGQWYAWLDSVGYTPSTATRYIQTFEQFGSCSGAKGIPIGKLFEIVRLPEEVDRAEFLSMTHTIPSTGEQKRVEEMTVKEAREVVAAHRGGEASPSKRGASVTGGATPYMQGLIAALSCITPDISALVESEVISLDSAIQIGKDLSAESQRVLSRIYDEHGDEEQVSRYLDFIVGCLKDGATYETVCHIFDLDVLVDDLVRDYPETETEIKEIERALNGIQNPSNATIAYALLSAIGRIKGIRERCEAVRRSKEVKDRRSEFVYNFLYAEYLRVLGLQAGTTFAEVRTAYRALSKRYHPDIRETGDAHKFRQVKDAYESLAMATRASA